jgi:hypothetical protein
LTAVCRWGRHVGTSITTALIDADFHSAEAESISSVVSLVCLFLVSSQGSVEGSDVVGERVWGVHCGEVAAAFGFGPVFDVT